MTDKELLDLAAKAAGIELTWVYEIPRNTTNRPEQCWNYLTFPIWNPLTDDGDALRLALNLGMRVSLRQADADGGSIRAFGEEEDSYAATRRAIVKAAAEIAKAKGE